MSTFSERLKQARENTNMLQSDLAKKLGIAKSTLSLYESGKREPDVEKIKKISKILNVDPNYLLDIQVDNSQPSKNLEKEFFLIFNNLSPDLQNYILKTTKELLLIQDKIYSN